MNELDNNEDLFGEKLEEGWKLDIPDFSGEELRDATSEKYLVPIFAKDDETLSFRGNGIIVGSYLVTAAHVAQTPHGNSNYPAIMYQYDGELQEVTDEDIVHDGRNVGVIDGNNDDLIIYKLKDILGGFICNEREIHKSMELIAYPYTNFDGKLVKSGGICKIDSLKVESGKGDGVIWKNCFKVNYPFRCTYGNSGSAVFVKNVLYGILIEKYLKGEGTFGKVIDARYIKKHIEEYELMRSQKD